MIKNYILKKYKNIVADVNIIIDCESFVQIAKIVFKNNDILNVQLMYTKYENLLDNQINNYIIKSRINKILKIKNTIDDKR